MSNEKKGAREAIDRMVKQMVENGTPVRYAEKKARDTAIKHDRKKENNR